MQKQAKALGAVIRRDTTVSRLGADLLSGKLALDDLQVLKNALQSEAPKELILMLNQSLNDIKTGLGTGKALRSNVEAALNAPIVDQLFIPFLGVVIQDDFERDLMSDQGSNVEDEFFAKKSFKKKMDEGGKIIYETSFKLKDMSKGKAAEKGSLFKPLIKVLEAYIELNPSVGEEGINLDIEIGKPSTLINSLRPTVAKMKPHVVLMLKTAPAELLNEVAKLFTSLEDFHEDFYEGYFENDYNLAKWKNTLSLILPGSSSEKLSSKGPSSNSSNTAYRQARTEGGKVDGQHLTIDGNTMGRSIGLKFPLRITLKGDISTSSRAADMVGSVSYNMNGTVVGMIQRFGNMFDRHYETSLLLSKSFGGFFIEGQAGFVGMREGLFSGWEGQRYQVTLGYDAKYVSPFIQIEYRPLTNGFSRLDARGAYVGLETDVLNVAQVEATFTSRVLMKVGYESSTETMLGQSLKPNQGAAAFVEWNGGLRLSNGLQVKGALTLGAKEQQVKLNIAFEQ